MTKAKAQATSDFTPVATKGMVFYTDGSCRPNPGNFGYGIHGYLYEETLPKRGAGQSTHRPTAMGYEPKANPASKNKEVTVLSYFDGWGSETFIGSNNTAEILGATYAIKTALQHDIKHLHLRPDSQLVIKGLGSYQYAWKRNNWITKEGQPVKNLDHWKNLIGAYDELKAKGCDIKITWVKGHNGEPGNEKADKLAEIAQAHAKSGKKDTVLHATEVVSYWKPQVTRNPLLARPWLYFRTGELQTAAGQYCMGALGKDKEFIGKTDANNSYTYVELKDPDPIIETIIAKQKQVCDTQTRIFILRLPALYARNRADDIKEFGSMALTPKHERKNDLYFFSSDLDNQPDDADSDSDEDDNPFMKTALDDDVLTGNEPLTREQTPWRLSSRMFSVLSVAKANLQDFKLAWAKQGMSSFHTFADNAAVFMDITSDIYDLTPPTEKKPGAFKLKKEMNSQAKTLDVNITLPKGSLSATKDNELEADIKLLLGADLPDRNTLKKLEETNPMVVLMVTADNEHKLRYCTIVRSGEDWGCWIDYYSSVLFIG